MSDETSMVPVSETMSMATTSADQFGHIEAITRSQIQARTAVAIARPRDLDMVRERLMKDANRPGFAEVAEYRKPQGRKRNDRGDWVDNFVVGESIRFVEAGIRAMGNLSVQTRITRDDDVERLAVIEVFDMESNAGYSQEIRIEKTVERKNPAGYEVIRTRLNKQGETVYIVRATDDDVQMKQAAQVSKAIRTLGLRMIPGDIVEDAIQRCHETMDNRDAQDPAAARKRLADGFAKLNVGVADLKAYLGHDLDKCSPAEMAELRNLYTAVREGHATWVEVMKEKNGKEEKIEPTGAQKAADAVKEKLAGKVKTEPTTDAKEPTPGALWPDVAK